ncbi:hypothetical protein CJ030_MR5G003453 [Morella rubra]|uniref:Secreted protein n=1 Tax=Morella rubra TaxID=262757 RepID=A0A6A1VNF9_9ROSI|nr:hypothetical protein CJ030_MR5G003453 [Morella rubra]
MRTLSCSILMIIVCSALLISVELVPLEPSSAIPPVDDNEDGEPFRYDNPNRRPYHHGILIGSTQGPSSQSAGHLNRMNPDQAPLRQGSSVTARGGR